MEGGEGQDSASTTGKKRRKKSLRMASMPAYEIQAFIYDLKRQKKPRDEDARSAPGDLYSSADLQSFEQKIEILEMELGLDTEETTKCGWGNYRPACLQRMAHNRCMLFWLCWFCVVQGLLVNGLVPSSISTIERRFQLSTSTIGRIMQFYDFGYVLFCIPVSYFGGRNSKPLFLAAGLLIMSAGSLVFSLPHFLYYYYSDSTQSVDIQQNNTDIFCSQSLKSANYSTYFAKMEQCEAKKASVNNSYFVLFCIAHFLHGIGATPLYTIGVSYIDENVRPVMSSLFLGIFYACAIFGPAIGFLLSATFLRYHTDFLFNRMDIFSIKPDANIVGAWWVGFVIASALGFIAVAPILSFPKVLPKALKYVKCRVRRDSCAKPTVVRSRHNSLNLHQNHHPSVKMELDERTGSVACSIVSVNNSKKTGEVEEEEKNTTTKEKTTAHHRKLPFYYKFWLDIRHIPIAVIRILTNGCYMLITVAMTVDGLLIAGASTFMAKYLERQFNVNASRANIIVGCIMVPMAGLGTMFSGFMVQYFKLTCYKTLKFSVTMALFSLILSPMYLIYCDHEKLIGLEINYPQHQINSFGKNGPKANVTDPSLTVQCNSHCACSASQFSPICVWIGNKRFAFYSPCYAGCLRKSNSPRNSYENCSCIREEFFALDQPKSVKNGKNRAMEYRVESGHCETKCTGLTLFLLLFAPFVFCTFAVGVPLISVILRTVQYEERSFALGIQWILVRVMGTVPAQGLFGWMFDVSCVRRHIDRCTGMAEGSCQLYNNKLLADLFLAFCVLGQTLTLLLLLMALICYARSFDKSENNNNNENNNENMDGISSNLPEDDGLNGEEADQKGGEIEAVQV